jgi:hypothetical protein
MNASIIGSSVVKVVFQEFGEIECATPKTWRVLDKEEAPGWVVVILTGSK